MSCCVIEMQTGRSVLTAWQHVVLLHGLRAWLFVPAMGLALVWNVTR